MRKGIHKISNDEYHSSEGLSSSDLKRLMQTPMHFRSYKENPEDASAEMLRGSLVHALILEPETVDSEYAVGDFKIRRGKDYDNLVKENEGKTVISVDEISEARRIVDAVNWQKQSNPELARLLTNDSIREQSFYWEDVSTGILCKVKPDLITHTGKIVDVKTCRDASFDSFQKAIVDYKYYLSAAFYLRGLRETEGVGGLLRALPTEFHFVCIETKAPYAVALYKMDAKALSTGSEHCNMALDAYAEGISTDNWTGYAQQSIEMGLPNWFYYKQNRGEK